MRRAPLLLLAAALLAGCTALQPADGPGDAPQNPDPSEGSVPPPGAAEPLALAIRLPERWVPPRVNLTATADSPPGTILDWYLANRNPPAPGQPGPLDRFPERETGDLEPGRPGRILTVDTVGRYVFQVVGAPNALLNVSVLPGTPSERATRVTLVNDAGWRFAPADVMVAEGTRLAFRNGGNATASAHLVDYQRPLQWRSALATFRTPSLLGDYDLVLVGHDRDGARGEASVRLIVDARIPEPEVAYGPYEGRLDRAGAPPPFVGARTHAFESRHNLTDVLIRWNATSEHPFGASVRVTLEQSGRVVARGPFAAEGVLQVPQLALGETRLLVEAGDGVDVQYQVNVTAERVLEPPESFFNRE